VIFSAPATLENAVRIQSDVRYWQQRARRNASAISQPVGRAAEPQALGRFDREDHEDAGPRSDLITSIMSRRERRWLRRGQLITRDWGVSLGAGATAGAGTFPAKFSFDTGVANCATDYVVFNTSLPSTTTQAGIVAFSNIYSGCGGTVPTTSWAYKTTGTGDSCANCAVVTSVVLALDGTQIAFVGSSATGSFLYILKPKATEGTVGIPAQPATSTTTAATYVTCRAGATSCLLSLPLGLVADANSAPFYDYTNDALYVGDNSGVLYKFTGVFKGTPTKLTTGGWPVTVHSGFLLTAPVRDQVSGNVYVGDSNGVLSFVRDTGSTVGTCVSVGPPCLANQTRTAGNSIVDAPIVDSTTQRVFVTVGNDGSGNIAVVQAPTDLTSNAKVTLGPQFGSNISYDGAFDNAYYTNVGTGHLYACGIVSPGLGLTNTATLFRVSFGGAGLMNSSLDGGSLALSNGAFLSNPGVCSPATEVSPSASSDLLFVSLTQNASAAGCAIFFSNSSCLLSISLPTAMPFTFPSSVSHTLPVSGGTSGIVVDNIVTTPAGTSQIYFTPLNNASLIFPCGGTTTAVGCAIQASQAGLN
jgi:hypothetical protein